VQSVPRPFSYFDFPPGFRSVQPAGDANYSSLRLHSILHGTLIHWSNAVGVWLTPFPRLPLFPRRKTGIVVFATRVDSTYLHLCEPFTPRCYTCFDDQTERDFTSSPLSLVVVATRGRFFLFTSPKSHALRTFFFLSSPFFRDQHPITLGLFPDRHSLGFDPPIVLDQQTKGSIGRKLFHDPPPFIVFLFFFSGVRRFPFGKNTSSSWTSPPPNRSSAFSFPHGGFFQLDPAGPTPFLEWVQRRLLIREIIPPPTRFFSRPSPSPFREDQFRTGANISLNCFLSDMDKDPRVRSPILQASVRSFGINDLISLIACPHLSRNPSSGPRQ